MRGWYRPKEDICQLGTLVRDQATLVAERGDWVRRMPKSLDPMNVRVHRAVSDIDGATGMAIIQAILSGERDPHKLAELRDIRCHKSEEEIAEELTGHWREDHLFSLRQSVKMYEAIEERIREYDKEILHQLGRMEKPELKDQQAAELKNQQKALKDPPIRGRAGAPGMFSDERSRLDCHRQHRGTSHAGGTE